MTAKPTHARYRVIVFAVSLAILSYISRVCISQAAPDITRDLKLSDVQMGYIFGAFGLSYALFEIPGGWLGDKMGPRSVLMRIVIWWSVFTAATGWMWNFTSLWIVRFLFGAGEAGGFPNLTKIFTSWLPHRERLRAQSFMWTAARWGGAFTPPLVVLAIRFMNWHWAFVFFGALGVLWAVPFYLWFRDDPHKHPSVNAAEAAIIGDTSDNAASHGDVPWAALLRSRSLWLLWLGYFCTSFAWYFYITWLPKYLQNYWKLSQATSAWYAVFPLLLGGFGCLLSGAIAPLAVKWAGGNRASRRYTAMAGCLGASLFLIVAIQMKDVRWMMAAMAMASFCNDLMMPPAWAACMDLGGKYAGTVAGSMNMMGNLAGFAAPVFGGYILRATGQNWSVFLYTMAAVYLVAIDPVTPIETLALHPSTA